MGKSVFLEMSGKIVLISAVWIFATIPTFNTLWTPNSFRHFQQILEQKHKTILKNVDMKEPLIQELKVEDPSPGTYIKNNGRFKLYGSWFGKKNLEFVLSNLRSNPSIKDEAVVSILK